MSCESKIWTVYHLKAEAFTVISEMAHVGPITIHNSWQFAALQHGTFNKIQNLFHLVLPFVSRGQTKSPWNRVNTWFRSIHLVSTFILILPGIIVLDFFSDNSIDAGDNRSGFNLCTY